MLLHVFIKQKPGVRNEGKYRFVFAVNDQRAFESRASDLRARIF
jgi:hypothetical protein